MPFSIRKQGNKFQVVNQQTGKVHGTHATKEQADQQLRALYANVPDAQKKDYEIMEIVTKSLPMELVPVEEPADAYPGNFHAIISSPRRDRDGDQLWADEWEQPLPDHIVVNGDHDNNHIMSIVGSGQPQMEADNKVHVRGSYAETDFAQDTRKLVNGKHLRTLSCAYREKRAEKGLSRELVNASFVVVPSNVDCVVVESKSHDLQIESNLLGRPPTPLDVAKKAGQGVNDVVKSFVELTTKELQAMTPDQRVQAIHDMASQLGSVCAPDAGSPVEMKSTDVEQFTIELEQKDGKNILHVKDADGKTITSHEFSQAPEAPSDEADHDSADQAKAFALAKAKAMQITMGTRNVEELENA